MKTTLPPIQDLCSAAAPLLHDSKALFRRQQELRNERNALEAQVWAQHPEQAAQKATIDAKIAQINERSRGLDMAIREMDNTARAAWYRQNQPRRVRTRRKSAGGVSRQNGVLPQN